MPILSTCDCLHIKLSTQLQFKTILINYRNGDDNESPLANDIKVPGEAILNTQKARKHFGGWDLPPDSAGEAYSATPDSLAGVFS